MMLKLIRLTFLLAAVAAGAGVFGPAPQRGLFIDLVVILLAAAFLLWRADAALRARLQRTAPETPAVRLLAEASHREHVERRLDAAVRPGDALAARLHGVGDVLCRELGARSLRLYDIDRSAGRHRLVEHLGEVGGPRVPGADLAAELPAARAAITGTIFIDLPRALAVPVVAADGQAIAVIELATLDLDIDVCALELLLSGAAQRVLSGPTLRSGSSLAMAPDSTAPASQRLMEAGA